MNQVTRRILVVDDDENICELFNDFLKREGHEPTTVKDGKPGKTFTSISTGMASMPERAADCTRDGTLKKRKD